MQDHVNDVQRFCRRKLDNTKTYDLLVNVWTPDVLTFTEMWMLPVIEYWIFLQEKREELTLPYKWPA